VARSVFGTRLGFYFAAIGSAFGLGSLWRFPYVVADNGGGAFVLLYGVCLLVLGLPLLIGELILGKFTRRSVISATRQVVVQKRSEVAASRLLRWAPKAAQLSVLMCVLILSYYAVICGWVLFFFCQFLMKLFSFHSVSPDMALASLKGNGALQIALTGVHLVVVALVVLKDVEDGIEKAVGYLIPVFIGIILVLVLRAFELESQSEGLRFFLYPDFSKLKWSSLGAVVGHLCFTLSLGFATMVTFGSYLRDENRVAGAGFRVAGLDSMAALVGGLLMFPLLVTGLPGAISTGATEAVGLDIMFQILPSYFLRLDGGVVFGLFFFLCLYLASLGASISILETVVANLRDGFQVKRRRATAWSALGTFLVSMVPALSTSVFANVRLGGRDVLHAMDYILICWIVPLLALFLSQLVVYKVIPSIKRAEFGPDSDPMGDIIYSHWSLLMKWVVPPLVVLGLIFQI
jgi:neurotransmitter:Na+ symporter, NSS family